MAETKNASLNVNQNTCPECGLLHPPCTPGTCPIAKEQQLKHEAENAGHEKLILLVQAIQSKLLEKLKNKPEEYANAVAEQLFKYIEKIQ